MCSVLIFVKLYKCSLCKSTGVPPYPPEVPSRTPSGCLTLQIVTSPKYTVFFFLYVHAYDKI